MWRNRQNINSTLACIAGCALFVLMQRIIPEPIGGIVVSLIFLGNIIITGLLGGWRFGLAATIAGFLSAMFLFSPPYMQGGEDNPVKFVRIMSFFALGFTFTAICELLRRAWLRIEIRQRQLESDIIERRRAQLAEQVRADELMTTLASISDGVIRIDEGERVTYMNPVAEELIGWPSEQAEGHVLSDIFHVVDEAKRRRIQFPSKNAVRYIHVFGASQDCVLVSKNGTERPVEGSVSPIRDVCGNVIGSVLVFRDIGERQQHQAEMLESERRYRAIGESIDYGVWICDSAGRNTYASDSFLRLLGITQEDCSVYGWGNFLHPDDIEATITDWKECVQTGARWYREQRFKGSDGNWHYILSRGVPVHNEAGEITSWVGINLDISRLKQVEAELRVNDRRKDEFLAILAHELRNPLAPIVNSLQVLRFESIDAETLRQSRKMIERQVHHLVRLVDDLLDVSRIMRGKIELRWERLDLATVVARAVEIAKPMIDAKQHQLEIDVPPASLPLQADAVRLAQSVANLLTNSAKYTPNGGRICVSGRRDGDQVILSVKDNGIGIDPDMLTHIFELFIQANQGLTKSQGGLGVGLTLVKSLIELHGGTVQAHSSGLGQGSEFVVMLPMALESSTRVDSDHSIPTASSTRLRLLVVDDNHDAASSLSVLLSLQGHEVKIAHSGIEAMEIVSTYIPHLILLDIGMPNMDGFEVTRRLREMPELDSTVIVALTGCGQPEDRRRAAEVGFDHHLMKPLEGRLLEKILDDCKHKLLNA